MSLVYALDLHSSWGPDLTEVIRRHRPQHVVLHTYHGFEAARHAQTFRSQVESVKANGVTLGDYFWAFDGYDPVRSVHESTALFREAAGHDPPVVWADCETYDDGTYSDAGPDVDWLHAAGRAIDALGLRKGLYTSPSYARERWGDRAYELADWLLWLATWDFKPTLESPYLPLYGWTRAAGKQWAVRIPGDEEIDRDVFAEEFTVPLAAPAPEPSEARVAALEHALRTIDDAVAVRLEAPRVTKKERLAVRAEVHRIRCQYLGDCNG